MRGGESEWEIYGEVLSKRNVLVTGNDSDSRILHLVKAATDFIPVHNERSATIVSTTVPKYVRETSCSRTYLGEIVG